MFELSGCKWTPELIDYALMDVEYLVPLREAQMKRLHEEEMIRLAEKIELPLVPITGLLEIRGVRIDEKECKAFQEEMQARAAELQTTLVDILDVEWKKYALPLFKKNHAIYKKWADSHQEIVKRTNKDRNPENRKKVSAVGMEERQAHELVKPFRTPPKPPNVINLNSNPQMRHALESLEVYLPNLQKATLEDAAGEHPVLDEYLSFRKYEKLGQMAEIHDHINRVTGRVHQTLNQNVDTGRLSSRDPNLMQAPAKADEGKRFRALFKASKGCSLIVADYAAIELIIIGIKSGDKKLLHALNNNLDLHCWTMSHFLDCSYDSLVRLKDNKDKKEAELDDFERVAWARKKFEKKFDLPELKKCKWDDEGLTKWVKTFRDYCKTLTYGIAYGLSSFGLSRKFHCDSDSAQQFIDV
jgi:DNA polymerase I-like protein with 3'-5' exonuclease and polymerase domains